MTSGNTARGATAHAEPASGNTGADEDVGTVVLPLEYAAALASYHRALC